MICFICESPQTILLTPNFPGYIDGTTYPIYQCKNCETHFVPPHCIDESLYETIYANPDAEGYQRYFEYATKIKKSLYPIDFLAKNDPSYYPIKQYIRNKKPLRILEVGCGYGYLTYSLQKMGHDATGIDLSKTSTDFAKKNFGNFFFTGKIEDFLKENSKSFDVIIATELIEHLSNPQQFLKTCKLLLKDQGEIVLTTPNKDYFSKKSIYQTDLPPVHLSWLGKKSFEYLASDIFTSQFFDFRSFFDPHHNMLLHYFLTRTETLPSPILDASLQPYHKSPLQHSFIKKVILKILMFTPIRILCNKIKNIITPEHYILGVTLRMK